MHFNNGQSFYEILNLSPSATDEDVKRAYRKQAKTYHPDLNPQNRRIAELRLKLINEAYAGLKTQHQRAAYNRALRLQARNDNGEGQTHLFSSLLKFFQPAPRPAPKDL